MDTDKLRPLVLLIIEEELKRRNEELDKMRNRTLFVLTILLVLVLIVSNIKHL